MNQSRSNREFIFLFFMLIFFITLSLNLDYRRNITYIFGDEAVYIMMAQSLAYDRDLLYEKHDLERFYESGYQNGPQGVFLTKRLNTPVNREISADYGNSRIYFAGEKFREQFWEDPEFYLGRAKEHNIHIEPSAEGVDNDQTVQDFCIVHENIYYSKFLVYPLFVSPFVLVFGDKGFILFNLFLFFLIILMGYKYLKKYNSQQNALIYTLLFFLVSVTGVYALWITPEMFNMFLVTAGFFMFSKYIDKQNMLILIFSALCFAIAGASKLPNAVFMISIGLYLLSRRKILTIFLMILVFSAGFLSFYAVQYMFTGNYNAYSGDRKTFYWNYPFQDEGYLGWERGHRLSNEDYFEQSFYFNPKTLALNAYYYIFGRFTGLFPYFIFSIVSLFIFLFDYNKKHRTFIFISIVICIFSYIIMAPDNYQGGGGAVGNRFFLNIFPAFLFLVEKVKSFRLPILASLIGISFIGVILINPFVISFTPYLHALAPIYRILPVEYTLLNTLPTLINNHTMVQRQDRHVWYRIHKFDENSLNQELGGFWLKGKETSEFALRIMDDRDLKYGILTLFNGYNKNKVSLDMPSGKYKGIFFPGETRKILFELKKSYPYFDSRVYPFKFSNNSGFIPRFNNLDLGNLNSLFLGFLYYFHFNFSDTAEALYENREFTEAEKYADLAFGYDPLDIRTQNLIFRLGHQKNREYHFDFNFSLKQFIDEYHERNKSALELFGEDFTTGFEENCSLDAFNEMLEILRIRFPLESLESTSTLSECNEGIYLRSDRQFSVQTPRIALTKGKYRVIFELYPCNYEDKDENGNEDESGLLFVIDANSRINTVHCSYIVNTENNHNIYSLDIDLLVSDMISFRLNSFNTDNYILKSISLIPAEPVEYYINYLNYHDISDVPFVPDNIGFGREFLNYRHIRDEDRSSIMGYFNNFSREFSSEKVHQHISNGFLEVNIHDLVIEKGNLQFKSSFLFKRQINCKSNLYLRITKKGLIRKILRLTGIRKESFNALFELHRDLIPTYLLPADYLMQNEYSIKLPDHINSEKYDIDFSLIY